MSSLFSPLRASRAVLHGEFRFARLMSRNYKKEKRGRVSVATSLFLDTLLALFPFFGDFFFVCFEFRVAKKEKKILSFLFGACGGLLYR